jgi:hypothetical protein
MAETTRELDRFKAKAAEVLKAVMDAERRGDNMDPIVAAALRAEAAARDEHWRKRIIFWFNDDAARAILAAHQEPAAAPAVGLVVCEYCEYPHPLNDDGTKCRFPKPAPAAETGKARCQCIVGAVAASCVYAAPGRPCECACHATPVAPAPDLLTLLRDLFGYIEDGTLVRNTACDAQPGWAPKAMKLVMTLKRVQEAIAAPPPGKV